MKISVEQRSSAILEQLGTCPTVARYVDPRPMPTPFLGSGQVRLIVLGQDPTVRHAASRDAIKTVLNLDRQGALRSYIDRIVSGLGLDLETHAYATNVVKNFFTEPPTSITEIDVLRESARHWMPLLRDELADSPGVPIVSLGEPVLRLLVGRPASQKVGHYWGYTKGWRSGDRGPFSRVEAGSSVVGRTIYPFPHQPSIRKRFYSDRFDEYVKYVRAAT
jgi:hypothetical protein